MPPAAEPPKPSPQPNAPPAAESPPSKTETAPFNNPFSDIDELFKDEPGDAPEAAKPAPEPKAQPKAPVKPADKAPTKPEDKGSGPKELRAAYESASKRLKELESEREKWSKQAEDPEKKTLSERLEAVEKRRAELEDEIKFSAYERSQEYKDTYLAPLERALKSAYQDVAQLNLETTDGEKATPAHLNTLCRMDLPAAISQSKEWFGDASTEVLAMRRHILELRDQAEGAVEQFRKNGVERERQRSEMSVRQRDEQRKSFQHHVDEGIEKHPDLFKASEEDGKGKQLLTRGMALADSIFEGGNGIPPAELVKIHAAIRNKAGGYDYLAYRWRQGQNRIKELETKLAEYEASDPGEGSGKRVPKGSPTTWEQEIEALATE